ncbi:hypothetical protein M5D96_013369 [Drosophila gunungcola]|uniref:Uncharacterized protein n=1 Tax=Drosophila gunungcola TaxID=103775 RepID=A0A9P9YBG1_9MUSC|nr:hypothetical protein M5D96_013369 [Drosophila gunungcola]
MDVVVVGDEDEDRRRGDDEGHAGCRIEDSGLETVAWWDGKGSGEMVTLMIAARRRLETPERVLVIIPRRTTSAETIALNK